MDKQKVKCDVRINSHGIKKIGLATGTIVFSRDEKTQYKINEKGEWRKIYGNI